MIESKPNTPRPGKPRLLLFSLIPALSLFLLAEITLRLGPFELASYPLEVPLEIEIPGAFEARMFSSHLRAKHFLHDRTRFWRPRPSRRPFNDLGYRGEVLPKEKPPGELRILAVGDSNTLGNEASWVDELPGHFATTDRVTVLNAGVYGYTSHQGRIHLEEYLRYRPDVVLISFGGNDASRNHVADRDFLPPRRHRIYARFAEKLFVLRLVEKRAADLGCPEIALPGR